MDLTQETIVLIPNQPEMDDFRQLTLLSVCVTTVWVMTGLEVIWNWFGAGNKGLKGFTGSGGGAGATVVVATSSSVRVTVETGRDRVDKLVTRPLNTGTT